MSSPEETATTPKEEPPTFEANVLGTKSLEEELKLATFSIFSDITDLGYFSWEPTGPYKKLVHASAQGIRHYLRYDGKPLKVEPVEALQKRCPLKLMKLPPIGKDAKYPYDTPLIAALHVMLQTKRRETYDDIDFVFFGSAILDLLATTKVDSNYDYVAQWIPGTRIIGVKAVRTTRKNLGAHQTQFEKLSFGKHLSAPVQFHTTFHMQLMTIGRENGAPEEGADAQTITPKKVLFASECLVSDDTTGAPVEVKLMDATSAAKCMKTSFQMISCGISTLYAGEVTKAVLTDVKKMSLSEVVAIGASRPISRRRGRNHNRNRRIQKVDEEKKEEDHEVKAQQLSELQDQDEDDEDKKEEEEGNDDDDEIVVGAGGVKEYEGNILKGLGVLQKAVDDGLFQSGKLLHLGYYKGSLIVYPDSLFPSDPSIVPDLLQEIPPSEVDAEA